MLGPDFTHPSFIWFSFLKYVILIKVTGDPELIPGSWVIRWEYIIGSDPSQSNMHAHIHNFFYT